MRLADHRLRAFGQQRRRRSGVLGIRSAMKRVPWTALNSSASAKLMPKKRPASASQNGQLAALVHHSAKLGQRALAEAPAMLADEQIAAAREQRAPAAGALAGMEEQAADFRRALEVGGQGQQLVAEGLAELGAGLGQRAQMVGIEGLDRRRPGRTPGRCRGSALPSGLRGRTCTCRPAARPRRARTIRRSARAWRPGSPCPGGRLVKPPPVSLAIS